MQDTRGFSSRTALSSLTALSRRAGLPLLVFVLLVGALELAASLALVDPMVLPAPSDVAANFVEGFRSGIFGRHLKITLLQAFAGFLLACAAGISLGTIFSLSERLGRALQPILIAVESMPKIALAPLIIVWFGYGAGSKIVLVTAIGFFPVFISTVAGLRAAETGRLDVLRALGAGRGQLFRLVALPSALPHIFAGINVAVVLALSARLSASSGRQGRNGHVDSLTPMAISIRHRCFDSGGAGGLGPVPALECRHVAATSVVLGCRPRRRLRQCGG